MNEIASWISLELGGYDRKNYTYVPCLIFGSKPNPIGNLPKKPDKKSPNLKKKKLLKFLKQAFYIYYIVH